MKEAIKYSIGSYKSLSFSFKIYPKLDSAFVKNKSFRLTHDFFRLDDHLDQPTANYGSYSSTMLFIDAQMTFDELRIYFVDKI